MLSESEFAFRTQLIDERRAEPRFLPGAWVFLPDHWHAILYPAQPLTISRAFPPAGATANGRLQSGRTAAEEGKLRPPLRYLAFWQAVKAIGKTEEEEDGVITLREKERFSNVLTLVFSTGRVAVLK